jgi:hypothetical protein
MNSSMDIRKIQNQLARLNIHPVNLGAVAIEAGQVVLSGSLLSPWKVPTVVDSAWFLKLLGRLPDAVGGRATMEAFSKAHLEMVKGVE